MKTLIAAMIALMGLSGVALADEAGDKVAGALAMAGVLSNPVALPGEKWALNMDLAYTDADYGGGVEGSGTAIGAGVAFKLNDSAQINASWSAPTDDFGDVNTFRVGFRLSDGVLGGDVLK